MPNMIFIGYSHPSVSRILHKLSAILPDDMEDSVHSSYPNEAPVYVTKREKAPYIILRGDDLEQLERIRKGIQEQIEYPDGPPDIEMQPIRWCPENGKVTEESGDR